MHFTNQDILELEKVYRLNLINSITGIKPGNLIATKSNSGQENVAIFSSVVHLGSNPALIGLAFRPQFETKRDTYRNILENGLYTINHIPISKTENAHYTSAKFNENKSEFEACGFTPEYIENFDAPFVAESRVKLGMELQEMIPIQANNTILVVGKVQHLIVNEELVSSEGVIDLEQSESAGIAGVNTYYSVKKHSRYPYAKVDMVPEHLK